MTGQRLMQTIKINLLKGQKRTAFMRSVFAGFGEDVSYFPRVMPLYPELIKFGNNIVVASGVNFVTHDAIHAVLNRLPDKGGRGRSFKERAGCIEIGDNVFIGANSTIMYNTRIGSNVIIGAGSLILRDIEESGVYAGTPVRRIKSFEDFVEERFRSEPEWAIEKNQHITSAEIDALWAAFYREKDRDA